MPLTKSGAYEALRNGIELVQDAVSKWSDGDLAGAINALEEWADDAQSELVYDSNGEPIWDDGWGTPSYMPEDEEE